MFLGHGLAAFALVALAGRAAGIRRERAFALSLVAAGFATVPDVDILYAPVGLLGGVGGPFEAAAAFWETGNVIHRAATHALPVGVVAAAAFACWATRRSAAGIGRTVGTAASVGLLGGMVVVATLWTGLLAGAVLAAFATAGLGIAAVAARHGFGPRPVAGAALVGLLSHPFGDLFTGEPPALLYPFGTALVTERVVLHPDPTLHLLGAFGIELLAAWLAAYAYFRLRDERVREYVSPRAALGLGYAGAALALPAPTLEASYHFVFSILAVGTVGSVGVRVGSFRRRLPVVRRLPWPRQLTVASARRALVTGLSAVTLAALGYTLAYLAL